MTTFFEQFNPVSQALIATLFTWAVTAAGASIVLFTKNVNRKFLDTMLGFAAGVMIAASSWSLLAPSIKMAEEAGTPGWLPAAIGFMGGGIFMRIIDKLLPHLHLGHPNTEIEGIKTSGQRSTLLVLAITLHNIPGGLAIGVAFGAAAVMIFYPILPYALAFAAGAMIFVVVEEVIPESQIGGNGDIATMGAMAGFTVMMILDVALG